MSEFKSKHAFGSEERISEALSSGAVDAFDILFLNEGKIGWITKDGTPKILEDKQQVIPVSELPEVGEEGVVYVYNNKFYFWNGEEFVTPDGQGIDEASVDEKIEVAKNESKDYTDEQIANAFTVVEF